MTAEAEEGAGDDMGVLPGARAGESMLITPPAERRPGLRHRVRLTDARGNPVTRLSGQEIASWRAVGGELLPRLWQHLRRRAGVGFMGPDPGEVQGQG